MKKSLLAFFLAATLPLLCRDAQAQQPPPQINVSGSAEIKVTPDEVDLSVSVESRDASLDVAKKGNDDSVAKTLDFLKKNGVPEKDIQTDYISIEPVYDSDNNFRSRPGVSGPGYDRLGAQTKPLYYQVSKGLGIKLTDVSSFDKVLTGLIVNGVNTVQGIDFRTSELRKYKDQARAMAIRAAKEKADAMASELGVQVGKPYNINVNESGGWNSWAPGGGGRFAGGAFQNAVRNAGGDAGENGPTFAVGQISVSASVNVSFLIK